MGRGPRQTLDAHMHTGVLTLKGRHQALKNFTLPTHRPKAQLHVMAA